MKSVVVVDLTFVVCAMFMSLVTGCLITVVFSGAFGGYCCGYWFGWCCCLSCLLLCLIVLLF